MSYVLKSTKWPSILPDKKIQGLISGFYELMDNKEADAGHRLAEEIFTRDGKLVAATGTFAGSQGECIMRSYDCGLFHFRMVS